MYLHQFYNLELNFGEHILTYIGDCVIIKVYFYGLISSLKSYVRKIFAPCYLVIVDK